MKVSYGRGTTIYGPGVNIELSGDEVATAIDAYLVAHNIHVSGPRTIRVNGELCEKGSVYVDPEGFVIQDGIRASGRGPILDLERQEYPGHCAEGDRCVCGGDTPRVRSGCTNWRTD